MVDGKKYEDLMGNDRSKNGFIFESVVQILHLHKMLPPLFQYKTLYKGYENGKKGVPVKYVDTVLDVPLNQGNDASDITYSDGKITTCISVKYQDDFHIMAAGITTLKDDPTIRIAYICRDKSDVIKGVERSHHHDRKEYHIFKNMIANNLILDESDIRLLYDQFQVGHPSLSDVQEFYLKRTYNPLQMRLHQVIALNKFHKNRRHRLHLLAHVPRSGKSITLMRLALHAIQKLGIKRVLIVTPIIATIESFRDTVKDYRLFAPLGDLYMMRDKKQIPSADWSGVAISSIQYFKVGELDDKCTRSFDMIISDEAHIGSTTHKSRTMIFDVKRASLRYIIFASGTPCDTAKQFNIPSSCQYHWTDTDNHMMKDIQSNSGRLRALHGPDFTRELDNPKSSKDYSHVPGHVYLKSTFDDTHMKEFNAKHPEWKPKGISWQSVLALNPDGSFVLDGVSDGVEFLKEMLHTLIHDRRNDQSVYKRAELIRYKYGSRTFTEPDDFEYVLMFLPTHTNEGTIDPLQKALKAFVEKHGLWKKFYIVYDNASTSVNLESEKSKALSQDKRKIIILLGDKNTVGVTYHNCDLSIHLDTTRSLAFHKQKMARAATDAPGKKIYITADMNIQRNFEVITCKVKDAQKAVKCDTPEDAAEWLWSSNTFLIDPDDESMGTKEGYMTLMTELRKHQTEVRDLLELLNVDDVLDMLKGDHNIGTFTYNGEDMEGENQTTDKGERDDPDRESGAKGDQITPEEIDVVNRTLGLMKKIVPMNAIISRRVGKRNAICDSDIFKTETMPLLMNLDPGIKLCHDKVVMSTIKEAREQNQDVILRIEDIFRDADFNTVRRLVSEYFPPSYDEKKNQAEVSTPPPLVDEMLSKVPVDFWSTPKRVLEPCCGKGNFVLAIFQKFDDGLATLYPDTTQRHQVIVEQCIHFTDLTPLNVFITIELLRCASGNVAHFYNSRVGDTLGMKWDDHFAAVIGNPPYNRGKNSNFYTGFITFSQDVMDDGGLLVYVIPNRFLVKDHKANKICNTFQMVYIHHTLKDFVGISTDIGFFVAMVTNGKIDNTRIKTNKGYLINLNNPTPTKTDDEMYKRISDKIMAYPTKFTFKSVKEFVAGEDLFSPRHWTRYAPGKKCGGSHVFQIFDDVGPDGRCLCVADADREWVKWYLTRSKAVRFFTAIYASSVFIPPFMWSSIPLPPGMPCTDDEVFVALGFDDSEISFIHSNFS